MLTIRYPFTLLALLFTLLVACSPPPAQSQEPTMLRNLIPPLFNPYRKTFTCVHQDTVVPAIDPQAELWLQQALALESPDISDEDTDYKQIITLTKKAAERKHWQAMLNLIHLRIEGKGDKFGLPNDNQAALQELEAAMALKIPAAFDLMGYFYDNSIGVHGDSSKAYAFYQMAADMGSPEAMTFLAKKMNAVDKEAEHAGVWANTPIAIKMLECAFAQGYGQAGYNLHYEQLFAGNYSTASKQQALKTLQEGTKMGDTDCANALRSAFGGMDIGKENNLALYGKDPAREERYFQISRYLDWYGSRLKLPNLDKVVPLPPAKLPPWDGDRDHLIDAAKGLRPLPLKPKTTNNGTGRYAIPEGHKLVPANYPDASDMSKVPVTAYWKPYAYSQNPYITNLVNQVPAGLYQAGETFDKIPDPATRHNCGGVRWQCYVLVDNRPAQHPRIVAGLERGVEKPDNLLQCAVGEPCPATGTWRPLVINDHPMARSINQLWRQSWFTAGATMPDLPENMGVNASDVTWQLLELDLNADKV